MAKVYLTEKSEFKEFVDNVVTTQETAPESPSNRLNIDPNATSVDVPTWQEFVEVSNKLSQLSESVTDVIDTAKESVDIAVASAEAAQRIKDSVPDDIWTAAEQTKTNADSASASATAAQTAENNAAAYAASAVDKLERYILRLVSTGTAYRLEKYETGEVETFAALLAAVRDKAKYVVCVYGNSKLRPQYVGAAEVVFTGLNRDSTGADALRMIVRQTGVQYDTYPLQKEGDYATNEALTAQSTRITNVAADLAGVAGGDAWSPRTYTSGEVCIYNNKAWKCIADTTSAPSDGDTGHWQGISLKTVNNDLSKKGCFVLSNEFSVVLSIGTEIHLNDSILNYEQICVEFYAYFGDSSRKFSGVTNYVYSNFDKGYYNRYINISLYYNETYNACAGLSISADGKTLKVEELRYSGYVGVSGALVVGTNKH